MATAPETYRIRATTVLPFDEHWLDITAPQARLMTIPSEMASRILAERNNHNRGLKKPNVARMQEDLLRGRWQVNGQTLAFDWDGELRDGQNRLTACVRSGVPLVTWVVFGIDPAAFATIDIGVPRGGADILVVNGSSQGNILAATLALVWLEEEGHIDRFVDAPPKPLYVDLLRRHPGVEEACRLARTDYKWRPLNPKILGFCIYRFGQFSRDEMHRFFADLRSGEELADRDPVLMLRNRLIDEASSRRKTQKANILAIVIKAWNARRRGVKVATLRWGPDSGEAFPSIL